VVSFFNLVIVLNFTVKDGDKEREEESDYNEEGNYTIFVYSVVSLVRGVKYFGMMQFVSLKVWLFHPHCKKNWTTWNMI